MDIERTRKKISLDKNAKENIIEREIILKSEIFETQQEIEDLKKDIKNSEKELEAWIITRTQKEDDEKQLQGYLNEDSEKIKELRQEIER